MARIFIALPLYKKMPEEEEQSIAHALGFDKWICRGYHPALGLSLTALHRSTKHEIVMHQIIGSLADSARCNLLGVWLEAWKKGDKYDYFWMLDSDVGFNETAIDSMIAADKPIIGASYSYKLDWGKKAGQPVCKMLDGEKPDKNGIVKARWLNGGFVLSRADGLFKMMEKFPQLRYERSPEAEGDNVNFRESYAFWGHRVYQLETGQAILIGEDYSFSQYANEAGLENYVDLKVRVTHWQGTKSYEVKRATDRDDLKAKSKDWAVRASEIEGWMTPKELLWLSAVALGMDSVVEIGSWKGRSTKALLDHCPGDVYAVDHWNGSPGNPTEFLAAKEDIYSQFIENVGHYPNLRVMKMSSLEAAEQFNGKKADMVFIDGNHLPEAFRDDIKAWLPKCGKLIAGHDFPEVQTVVRECLGDVMVTDGIWYKHV